MSEQTREELIETLKRFYSVDTIEEVVVIQSERIERLQQKLERFSPLRYEPAVTKVREG